jgi:lambda family phage portal protein
MTKASAWDRFLLTVAPGWALDRLRKRAAADLMLRHYEAAQPGRRTQGWQRNAGDADVNIRAALLELRMHARDLIRNNGWARRGQRIIANNTVGWGLRPKPISPDQAVAAKAAQLWKAWASTTECESESRHTFYGIQHLAMKALVSDGEVLLRRRWRRPTDALTIPLQLQIMEADYLDHAKNLLGDGSTGPTIQGIEFDLIGRRSAYWLFEQHPGSGRNTNVSRRIPAEEVIHLYYTERPGQSRGISWFGAAIAPLKDFDQYEDATLMRQMIAACFAAFVTDTDGLGSPLGDQDIGNPLVEKFEPGMITQLPPGRSVTFANPPGVNDSTFDVRTLRRIAATLGVTYEDLTGDYSQVNFSSARMARLSHWANINDWRENMLIPLLCDGVWQWAMQAAQVAGELPAGDAPSAEWTAPPMPMIEPDKEGLAYSRLIRNGLMTHAEAIREQGGDPDAHWPEYAAGLKKLDELGIVLDSDPRLTTASGQEQASETADKAPEPAAPAPAPKAPPKRDDEIDIDISDLEVLQ